METSEFGEWIQYYCQFCGRGPVSAKKDSIAGRLRTCTVCLRKASVSETLKRLKPIDDPVITEALKTIDGKKSTTERI